MMASDVPSISWYGDGQLICMVCTSRCGRNAKRKPKHRMHDSLTTSSADTMPLKAVLSRTPMTLSTISPTMSVSVMRKCSHGWVEPVSTGSSWLV